MSEKRRLLILSCSKRKLPAEELVPAIQRYDGPCFRVLRRYLAEDHPVAYSPSILILSAEYGLIQSDTPIQNYERRMTRQRASALADQTHKELLEYLQGGAPYSQILLCMGKEYQQAMGNFAELLPDSTRLAIADGGVAAMQSALYDWLHGAPPPLVSAGSAKGNRLCGFLQQLTRQQVLEIAKNAIESNKSKPVSNYRSWYVNIEGQKIAPKWLVSQVTGLSVSKFHTQDANWLLTQLGISVVRHDSRDTQEAS